MTVRDVIRRARRLLLGDVRNPSGTEAVNDLEAFNAMLRGMLGHGVGNALRPATSEAGQAYVGGIYTDTTLTAPLEPQDGARFGVAAASTVTASGATIEGAASVSAVAGATWFYRADLNDWKLEGDLALGDDPFFPADIAAGLAPLLALELAGEYTDGKIPDSVVMQAETAGRRLKQRYRPRVVQPVDDGLLRMSEQSYPAWRFNP